VFPPTAPAEPRPDGRRFPTLALAAGAVLVASATYVTACTVVADGRNKAFAAVSTGDTESTVIARFGRQPSVREPQGQLFARYAPHPCSAPCVQRLWFENRLAFDIEAWSVELDQDGRVIRKAHWVSP
jgi:hypothetical protein